MASPWRTATDAFLVGAAAGPILEILLAFGVPGLVWALIAGVLLILAFFARFVPFFLWTTLFGLGLSSFAAAAAFLQLGHL